jgi:hypothetical protein
VCVLLAGVMDPGLQLFSLTAYRSTHPYFCRTTQCRNSIDLSLLNLTLPKLTLPNATWLSPNNCDGHLFSERLSDEFNIFSAFSMYVYLVVEHVGMYICMTWV